MQLESIDATNKKIALFVAAMTSFIPPLMSSSLNIALPSIGKEFSLNAVILGWVTTSFLLAITIFLVPFGRIADIYGRKRLFTYGVTIYAVFSFLGALSMSAVSLIVSRILQGIGGAMMLSTGVAILTSVFIVGERGKALGINAATTYIGLTTGPVLGGFMTQQFGWRSIFLLNVFVSIVVLNYSIMEIKGRVG